MSMMAKYKGRKVRFGKRGGMYIIRKGRKEYLPRRQSEFGFWPFDGPSIFGGPANPREDEVVSAEEAAQAQAIANRNFRGAGNVVVIDEEGRRRVDPFWRPGIPPLQYKS